MQKKKLLLIGAGVTGTLVAAMLVVPSFIDWSKYQSLAQQKLREATGYELAIGGALRIGLLPAPHASVHAVTLSKPSEKEAFLTFEDADVRLAFFPLLTGKVEVASVTLDKPVLTMVTKKDGSDNWKPATATQAPQTDAVTGEPIKAGAAPAVSIGALKVKDGKVIIRDEKAGTSQTVELKDLAVKADTLSGPFNVDGVIGYGNAQFDTDITTGGYSKGESLPVQLNVADKNSRAAIKWSGVVSTGDTPEMQGELDLTYSDLPAVLADIGYPVTLPIAQTKTRITGMLTASADKFVLTNGSVDLSGTRMAMKVSATGLKSGPKNIEAVIDSRDVVTLDPVIDSFRELAKKSDNKKDDKKEGAKAVPAKAADYNIVAASFELPADMKADIQLRGKGLEYANKKTGAFEFHMGADGGKGDAKLALADIPGGGDINVTAGLVGKGAIEGKASLSIGALKQVFVDWLKLADASAFENPMVPYRIDTDATFKAQGRTVTLDVRPLSIGETKLNGTIAYTAGARPLLALNLDANIWTMPGSKPAKAAEGEGDADAAKKAETKKADFEFEPPQLPFDLQFNIALGRFVNGDTTLTDVKAVGAYNGKGVSLTNATANVNGGAVSLAGSVADLKELGGIDVTAGLTTSDLESFVKAMTGKPLELSKRVGAFSGSAKAKGDKSKLNVDAGLKAWGFTARLAGDVADPFKADIPSTVNMRVTHPSFVEAVRTFSPGFGDTGGASKPIDVSGVVKISGKTYEISGLKGSVGNSDFAGSLKADMEGAVPSFTADLTSRMLDLGALVGVDSKGAAKASSGGAAVSSAPSSTAAPWSREPMDTGSLQSANLDISFKAGTLVYGTWVLGDAAIEVGLKNGTLKAPISGNLFGGKFSADLAASSSGKNTPLSVAFNADASNVNVAPFLSALASTPKKLADGTASVKVDLKGAGISSAALVSSLQGKADINASKPIIYGMDIDKLAADIVEAFDGGWKGVLAGFATGGLSGGQSEFKDISHSFPIAGGDMAVKDFTLQTLNSNATVVSNGTVSFSRWIMDVQSDVKVTQPKDVPVVGMRLAGPLNAATKSINSSALDNLVRSKVQSAVADKLGDKLKDSKAGAIINQFLGGGQQQQAPAPTPTPAPDAAPATAPTTPDSGATGQDVPLQNQEQPQQQQPQPSAEQQLLNGLINQLAR
ncbi:MAG: AsmA family protein [Alphaproteobacteria bacterium]|nr:AsmA family protein [Alphaproteobacteria bacterium]